MAYDQFQNDRATPIRGGSPVAAGEACPTYTRALWIGTGGTLVLVTDGGETLTFQNVSDGVLLPIHASSVDALTTCTDMLALY